MSARVQIRKNNPLAMAWMGFLLVGATFLYHGDQRDLAKKATLEASLLQGNGFRPMTVDDIIIR